MSRVSNPIRRTRTAACVALLATLTLGACVQEQATEPRSPLIPPKAPDNPAILSASWRMDVNRTRQSVAITPPSRGNALNNLQILGDYFGIEPGSPDLSILAGDAVEIVYTPASFVSSAVGAFAPGQVRTTFSVSVRNRLSSVNLTTPTFPVPPVGTTGVILFPFEIVVTQTPGGVTVGGDGTSVLVELPNRGLVAPSVDWDVSPFNFFNDTGCGPTSNDCYRSETFQSSTGTPVVLGGATSQSRSIGFDHDPTVSQFRVRMIVAGDLQDATPNAPPVATAGGPYTGVIGTPTTLAGSGVDPDGSITNYRWDFDADGSHDDSNSATGPFTCTTAGSFPLSLQVQDNRGGLDTDASSITCSAPANTPPTANTGGPYTGTIGVPITLNGSGTDNGSITAYAWDLDNDGAFDDAATASTSYTCTVAGPFTVRLEVTDNGTPALTGNASTTVTCGAAAPSAIRGRWVNAGGTTITTATTGSTVFLEVDIQVTATRNIHDFQGTVLFSSALATAPNAGADLNCTNPNSCPSGTNPAPPAATADDVMNQYTGSNTTPGQLGFLNFSVAPDANAGDGIQGLGRLQFTVNAAGTLSPTLNIAIAVDGAGADLNPTVTIPSLTIN